MEAIEIYRLPNDRDNRNIELENLQQNASIFQSETSDKNKQNIIKVMCLMFIDIRIVFATTALGMGIDVVAHSIILYGSPKSILDLVQEIGRVGRENANSVAILLHNSFRLVRANTCRRQVLSWKNLHVLKKECNKHTCCDNCVKYWSCGDYRILQIESLIENVDTVTQLSLSCS
ncbi:unnamed protein product [Mytilus edulis]|uniref:DNA 3'-5' helicase n=1 Tax=Mytilus edulis TaxID=6550 RepID=A0A8S3T6Y0_MYTED|nr:unnamed protein product [Mytilus edulis]